jgi:hypothetical protein
MSNDDENSSPWFSAMLSPLSVSDLLFPKINLWTQIPLAWCLQNLGEAFGKAYFEWYRRNAFQIRQALREFFETLDRDSLPRSLVDLANCYTIQIVNYPNVPAPFDMMVPRVEPTLIQKLFLDLMKKPVLFVNMVIIRDNEELPLQSFAYIENQWRFLGEPLNLLLHADASLLAQPGIISKATEYEDSELGLRLMIKTMVQASKEKDYLSLRKFLQQAKLPEPALLFTEMFGERLCKGMAQNYQKLWGQVEEHLLEIFYLLGESEDSELVSSFLYRKAEEITKSFGIEYLRLNQAQTLGIVDISGLRLLSWVYQDGAWRYTLFLPALVQFEENSEGLSDFVSLLQVLCDSDLRVERQCITEALRVPDNWFATHYKQEVAKQLSAEYQSTLEAGVLAEVAQEISNRSQYKAEARGHILALDQENAGLQKALLLHQQKPAFLYSLSFEDGYALRSFVWVGGHWRWLGKMRSIEKFEAPALRVMPPFAYYENSADGLETFLGDLTQHLYAHSTSSNESEFQKELREICRGLLLPDVKTWFLENFGDRRGGPLAADYTARVNETLLGQLLTSMVFGGFYKVSARPLSESQTFTEQFITKHTETSLFSSQHQNPENIVTHGVWTYLHKAWRYAASMQACTSLSEWSQELNYEQRFPETKEGLRAFFECLLASTSDDPVLFGYLLELCRPKEAKPEWFANISENPIKTATSYTENWEASASQLLRSLLRAGAIKDKHISLHKSAQAPVYGVFVHLPRQDQILGFAPLAFYEGAWRMLGDVFIQE